MHRAEADIAVIGAGAAGLMASVWAGRSSRTTSTSLRIVQLESAKSLGAKILVAGGGRCNVTHDVVNEQAFAGSSRNAIRKVLRRFDVAQTIQFFHEQGVELKREETGKLFPTTDKARTVLNALLAAAHEVNVEIRSPFRVESITLERDSIANHDAPRFRINSPAGELRAHRIILATGGRSLPKTGSDGHGYELARRLGHTITPRVFPALVPLTLPRNHFLCDLSGIAAVASLEVRSGSGRKLHSFTDSTLCTHFGLSGPCVLDISRYYTDAKRDDPATQLTINWLPNETFETVDATLTQLGSISCGRWLREQGLPERLAKALCEQAGVDAAAPAHQLTRERRRTLAGIITQLQAPVTGDRGYKFAEVTAGGVPLNEIRLETMESRICRGLFFCGEICDVDGRIGGYNFQWAWASGFVAGTGVVQSLAQTARVTSD